MKTSASENSYRNLLPFVGAALGIYWFALFVMTHLPPEMLRWGVSSADQMMADGGDKVLHFVAYAGLAFLFASWQWMRGASDLRLTKLTIITLFSYAIIDELLQSLVSRTADIMDAGADWIGVLIGLSLFFLTKAALTCFSNRVSSAKVS